jgi:hypothetical protein
LDGAGAWIKPTGNDIARIGVSDPKPFKDDQTMNLPTIVKDYGRIMVDDIMCVDIFKEIQTAINAMQATRLSPDGWYKNAVSGTPENYEGTVKGGNASNFFGTFDDQPCYGGPDPRYPCPARVDCPDNATDNEAVVEYLLQPGTCLWSCPACIDESGWYELDPGDGPGNPPSVVNAYYSGFEYNCDTGSSDFGNLMGGEQACNQTAVSAYLKISGVSTTFSAMCDFYDFGTATGSCPTEDPPDIILGPDLGNYGTDCQPCQISFNAYGQNVQYRKWTKFNTASIDSNGKATSSKLGDTSEPYVPSPIRPCDDGTGGQVVYDPPACLYEASKNDGYRVSDQTCILKWSFTYV